VCPVEKNEQLKRGGEKSGSGKERLPKFVLLFQHRSLGRPNVGSVGKFRYFRKIKINRVQDLLFYTEYPFLCTRFQSDTVSWPSG